MSGFNKDLAIKVREVIRANPERYDQTVWGQKLSCGTSHCIAGWVCSLSGVQLMWVPSVAGEQYEQYEYAEFTEDRREIPNVAGDLLGLDEEQDGALFFEESKGAALHMLDLLIEYNGELSGDELLNEADEYKRTPHV